MNNLKVVLNTQGVRELLESDEMLAVCQEHAEEIAKRCGDGYASGYFKGTDRWKSTVYADSQEARKDNSKNNTIVKAVGSL